MLVITAGRTTGRRTTGRRSARALWAIVATIALIVTGALIITGAPGLPAAWAQQQRAGAVSLDVNALKSAEGKLLIDVVETSVSAAARGDPIGQAPVTEDARPLSNRGQRVTITLRDTTAGGRYAVRVIHDRNGNGRLDVDARGIPTEGIGWSRAFNTAETLSQFDPDAMRQSPTGASLSVEIRY